MAVLTNTSDAALLDREHAAAVQEANADTEAFLLRNELQAEQARLDADEAYNREKNDPAAQQRQVDRIAAREISEIPNYLRRLA